MDVGGGDLYHHNKDTSNRGGIQHCPSEVKNSSKLRKELKGENLKMSKIGKNSG